MADLDEAHYMKGYLLKVSHMSRYSSLVYIEIGSEVLPWAIRDVGSISCTSFALGTLYISLYNL